MTSEGHFEINWPLVALIYIGLWMIQRGQLLQWAYLALISQQTNILRLGFKSKAIQIPSILLFSTQNNFITNYISIKEGRKNSQYQVRWSWFFFSILYPSQQSTYDCLHLVAGPFVKWWSLISFRLLSFHAWVN